MAKELKAKTKAPAKGKAKLGTKKPVTEAKVTMNFARHESSFNLTKVLIIAVILILAAGLFTKFAILDPMAKKTAAVTTLSEKQTQLATINAKLTGWDELSEKYGRYSYGWMTENEKNLVDRMQIIDLMETKIATHAIIRDYTINGNVLTLNLNGITLDQTSALVTLLEADSIVTSATVYKAAAEDAEIAAVNMVVILAKEVA